MDGTEDTEGKESADGEDDLLTNINRKSGELNVYNVHTFDIEQDELLVHFPTHTHCTPNTFPWAEHPRTTKEK